jgi:hypothetical protein
LPDRLLVTSGEWRTDLVTEGRLRHNVPTLQQFIPAGCGLSVVCQVIFHLCAYQWAEAFAFLTFISPLIVAVLAVWLAYVYQRNVADRESRRTAYANLLTAVSRMSDCLEHQEQLRFAWVLKRDIPIPPAKPEDQSRLATAVETLVGLSNAYPVSHPWFELEKKRLDGVKEVLDHYPVEIATSILRRFCHLLDEAQAAEMGISLGSGKSNHRKGQLSIWKMAAELIHFLVAASVALDRRDPSRLDWAPLNERIGALQTAMLRDLGVIGKDDEYEMRKYRGPIDWPSDVPVLGEADVLGEPPANAGVFSGPAFEIAE